MEIVTKIKPIFDDLITIGFAQFVKDNEFVRLCNEFGLTNHYTEAYNEVAAGTKNDWSWLGIDETNYDAVLAKLMNKLYVDEAIDFTGVLSKIVAAYLPHSYFVPSIANIRRDLQLLGADKAALSIIDESWEKENNNYHKKVVVLKNILLSRATGGNADDEVYIPIRASLLKQPSLKPLLPEFIQRSQNINEFWQFIKFAYRSYSERRYFLQETFEPLLNAALTLQDSVPHQDLIPQITGIDEQFITKAWRKALDRMTDDPEAAITSARSLIEIVCKHILDEMEATYDDAAELPKLYKQTASALNLSPDQHSEQLFKQILGGCQAVVEGLGGLRNKFGDAHGMSKNKSKPAPRHAALAVNLSGAMCSFLLQTYIHLKEKTKT